MVRHWIRAGVGLMLGCSWTPSDAEMAQMVAQGDLDQAIHLMEATSSEDWRLRLGHWQRLDQEVSALNEWERTELQQKALAALDDGRWEEALEIAVSQQLTQGPVVMRLQEVGNTHEESASMVGLYSYLKDVAPDEEASHWAERSRLWVVRARYTQARLADTRALQSGATQAMAMGAFERVYRDYRTIPDLKRMLLATQERLELLCTDPGIRVALKTKPCTPAPMKTVIPTLESVQGGLAALFTEGLGFGFPEELLTVEFIDAALGTLDPWTTVIWPAQIRAWKQHQQGVVVGVGLPLSMKDEEVFTGVPALNSPAYEAGVHVGDRLIGLGAGQTALVLSSVPAAERQQRVQERLGGELGTVLQLDVMRAGKPLAFQLERRPVPLELIKGWSRTPENGWNGWIEGDEDVLYLRIESFREGLGQTVQQQIAGLKKTPSSVILDLRGNPGGDVNAAVAVAELFVGSGMLAHLEGRGKPPPPQAGANGEAVVPWNVAVEGHPLEGIPVAVLVDHTTASSAELVAGALQQLAGADVIGQRTVGKGLSQVLRVDERLGFAMHITNTWWTLPNGQHLHREEGVDSWGVEPAIPLTVGPALRLQHGLMQHRREALRTHKDGTVVPYTPPLVLEDVPHVSADLAVERARLILQARRQLTEP